jgi:hypothetical protein
MEEYTIKLTNKRIYDFYKNNPTINIEALNLILLDFIQNINTDLSKTIQNTINQEILNSVKEIKNELSNNHQSVCIKFHELNKEYTESIKSLLQSSSSVNLEKINESLENKTQQFFMKINEMVPKHNDEMNCIMTEQLSELKDFLNKNTQKIENQEVLKDFLTTLDFKIQNIQQPIISYMNANQDNLTSKLNHLKDTNLLAQTNQDKIMTELGDFLNKYKTSSTMKGQYSENRLELLLHQAFKDAEIVNTSAFRAMGDFMIKRPTMPTILIENKNYKTNVNIDEVAKFLRDINEQKCHGIFMSQHSGIVGKTDFFIELHDGFILIYIHDVDYSTEKIKTAVNIIDNLYPKLQQISNITKSGTVIKKDLMDAINYEYQSFLSQKENLLQLHKEYNKKLQAMLDDIKLPSLQTLLNQNYASLQNQEWVCETCGEFFSQKKGLLLHKRKHREKNTDKIEDTPLPTQEKEEEKNPAENSEEKITETLPKTVKKKRKTSPRENTPEWSTQEDELLLEHYTRQEKDILQIHEIITNKTPGEIISRLQKLKIITRRIDAKGYQDYKNSDIYKDACNKAIAEKTNSKIF